MALPVLNVSLNFSSGAIFGNAFTLDDPVNGLNVVFAQGDDPSGVFRPGLVFSRNVLKHVTKAFGGIQGQKNLNTQIGLIRTDAFGIQKTFQVRSGWIRRIQLGEGRRKKKGGSAQARWLFR